MDGRKRVGCEAEYSVCSLQLGTRNFFDSFVVIVRKRHVTQVTAKLAELWGFFFVRQGLIYRQNPKIK